MPDVTELLEQDHRRVERLFQQYMQSNEPSVAGQICDELVLHTELEERLVYPVLGRDVEDGKELEREARAEHDEVDQLIKRLRQAGLSSDEAPGLVESMQAAVEHHVEEEETELFPKLRASLDSRRLEEMGEQLAEAKKRAQSGQGADGETKEELYQQAREEGIEGRSAMSKDELARALGKS